MSELAIKIFKILGKNIKLILYFISNIIFNMYYDCYLLKRSKLPSIACLENDLGLNLEILYNKVVCDIV